MEPSFPYSNFHLSYSEMYKSLNMSVPSVDNIALCLSRLLTQIVYSNKDKLSIESLFHSTKVPGISIQSYLRRQAMYSQCSPETFFLALIYIDRYLEKKPQQFLVSRNVHKLFFVSLLVAAKFNEDLKLSNSDFAKLGGVDKYDLCLLEIHFLKSISFNVNVTLVEFVSYVKSVTEFGEYGE